MIHIPKRPFLASMTTAEIKSALVAESKHMKRLDIEIEALLAGNREPRRIDIKTFESRAQAKKTKTFEHDCAEAQSWLRADIEAHRAAAVAN